MAKLALEGDTLVVQLSLLDKMRLGRWSWRIPLAAVRSASVDPQPWKTLSRIEGKDIDAPERPELDIDPQGNPAGVYAKAFRGKQLVQESGIIGVYGPPGSRIYANVRTGHPAVRVDLDETLEFRGLLLKVATPESIVTQIRARISQRG